MLSNIAGRMDDILLGLAPDAEFLLAIVAGSFKSQRELEAVFRRAVDWAHENGAHIINISMGYKSHYFPEDMDGETSFVAKISQIAAEKGLLVINSAGNEGRSRNKWRVITSPADVETVLTVGGIDPKTEIRSSFSSFGPSADGRLKPNICANGTTVAAMPRGKFRIVSGTSLAAPLVAGFVACVWQAHPDLKAQDIFNLVQQSGELYPYYDYAHGYGVPNARYFDRTSSKTVKTFDFIEDEEAVKIAISNDIVQQLSSSNIFRLYYHLQRPNGVLSEYAVVEVFRKTALTIPKERLEEVKQISVHFLGYTATYEIH